MKRKLVPVLLVSALIVSVGVSYLVADPNDPVVGPGGPVAIQPAPADPRHLPRRTEPYPQERRRARSST